MQALSRTLVGLYEAAEHCSIEGYPGEAILLVRSLIEFDGAILGTAAGLANEMPDLVASDTYVYQNHPPTHHEYDRTLVEDPITRFFPQGLQKAHRGTAVSFHLEHQCPSLEAFSKKHLMSQLMLFGEPQCEPHAVRWLMLYRRSEEPFGDADEQYLMALWPHLTRALARNRLSFLDRQLRMDEDRGAALIRMDGTMEATDSGFRRLLRTEWPQHSGEAVPDVVMQAFRTGYHRYTGTRIEISMRPHQGYIACSAAVNETLMTLTRTERIVAQQFASGYSNKDIALRLSVSQNTVRSHIAHIYTKLGVHDKAELANCIARKVDRRPVHFGP
jgi:DNA-binding CsgD family transcriptional regulator